MREIASDGNRGLRELRRAQLASPRVRGEEVVVDRGSSGHSTTEWRLAPGDHPFLTQNIQVHLVELPPGESNRGHGHQNEAAFYILEGRGYDIHDGKRYDWERGDLLVVHTDSVHRHFNASDTERAVALVIKAKATWMFLGLIQQGNVRPFEDEEGFGSPQDWAPLWTAGVRTRKKVVKPGDAEWETTRDGRVRVMCSKDRDDVRVFSIDLYEQEVPGGSRSAKHWHMADEILYVLSGSGYSLHCDVEAEITERYFARIAKVPTRHEFKAGDIVYIPQNTVHQHFNRNDGESLRFLSAQNRVIKLLGYDAVTYLEDAPEYEAAASPTSS